jgi:hypothetical protein
MYSLHIVASITISPSGAAGHPNAVRPFGRLVPAHLSRTYFAFLRRTIMHFDEAFGLYNVDKKGMKAKPQLSFSILQTRRFD